MTAAHLEDWGDEPAAAKVKLTDAEYFAAYRDYMSSHKLEDFRKSPLLFKAKYLDGSIKPPESSAFTFGRAAHVMILEGDAFDDRYAVGDGPINERTGNPYGRESKAFQEWLAGINSEGKEVVSSEEFDRLHMMDIAVHSHSHAAKLLESGQPEVAIRAHVAYVPCQSRLDWVCKDRGLIVDLKTCQSLGHRHTDEMPCKFARDAQVFGYFRQMAFYRLMVKKLTGKTYDVAIIAVEKEAPHDVGVFRLSRATLEYAERQVLEALNEYSMLESIADFHSRFENPIIL